MSPALEGEFLTTGPPGKSGTSIAFVGIEMDEADLWKDKRKISKILAKWKKQVM